MSRAGKHKEERIRLRNLVPSMSLVVFMLFPAKAYAQGQEVNTFFGGVVSDKGTTSWALEVEYKQLELLKYEDFLFDGSFSYMNEGHPRRHYRDGVTLQGWARMEAVSRLRLSLGIGPYFYNDTRVNPSSSTNGLGFATSFDAKYEVSEEFTVGARLNEAIVGKGPNATSLLWEVGYRLPDKEEREEAEQKNQMSFLTLGIPGHLSDLGTFYELRYARVIMDHVEVEPVNFFGRSFKEKGIAGEVCATNEFGNFKTGICAGPYYDRQRAGVVDIASILGDYNFKNTPWSVMIVFNRSSNLGGGRGIDVTSCGVGYKF